MTDQMAGLRKLAGEVRVGMVDALRARSARKGVRLIAVTSGKGGVGKTNLTVNLGLALVELGERVLVFDSDPGLANVNVILGLEPTFHLGHVLSGRCSLREAICVGPWGLRFISGGSALTGLADLPVGRVMELLGQLPEAAGEGEIVLFDTGAGLSGQVRAYTAAVPEVVVVTNPEPTALSDAYVTIKMVARENAGARIHLLINEVESGAEAREVIGVLARVVRRHVGVTVSALGYVPKDPSVPCSVRRQQPFVLSYPAAPASCAVKGVARFLLGDIPASAGGWGRFLTRFAELLEGRG